MNRNNKLRLFKHQIIITGIAVVAVVVSMIGGSYAIFSNSSNDDEYNVIQVGDLEISYVDRGYGDGDVLSLNGAYPMSDNDWQSVTPYRFSIENTGTITADFKIKLVTDPEIVRVDGCGDNLLDPQYIMYKLDNNDPVQLSTKESSGYTIYTGTGLDPNEDEGTPIVAGSSQIHELRIWIKSTAPNDVLGKHFHGKVVVESMQAGVDSRLTTTYEIGTHVSLIDGSTWRVLKQASATDATVTLIKDTNLSNMAFDTASARTSSSYCTNDEYGCNAYQKNTSTVLTDSSIKTYLETTYLESLKTSLASGNLENLTASLPSMEELAAADGQSFNQTQITSFTKTFLTDTTYWTKSPVKTNTAYVWYISSTNSNSDVAYANNTEIGVRPVITTSKLNIASIVSE